LRREWPVEQDDRLPMRAHVDVLTLAVSDLERALEFYRRLGLKSEGVTGTQYEGDEETPGGAAAMFELDGGLILALYGRSDLAKDASVPVTAPQSGGFSIGHLVSSREEVDAVLAEAEAAGATLADAPRERPWGIYSGYFSDLDGHLWEVIWNSRAHVTA
jgi:catechol 2,3-dioxygenase-like lactoylglutathione lyase family enzyme